MGIEEQATTAPSLLPAPSSETIVTWTRKSNEKAREGWREAGTDRPAEVFKDADLLWPQLSSWRDRTWGAEDSGARGKGERGRQASTRRGCVEGREKRGGWEGAL